MSTIQLVLSPESTPECLSASLIDGRPVVSLCRPAVVFTSYWNAPPDHDNSVLTVTEFARESGVPRGSVPLLIRTGRISAVKMHRGRKDWWLISRSEVGKVERRPRSTPPGHPSSSLTTTEFAAATGLSVLAVRNLILRAQIPAIRVLQGGRPWWFISESALADYQQTTSGDSVAAEVDDAEDLAV